MLVRIKVFHKNMQANCNLPGLSAIDNFNQRITSYIVIADETIYYMNLTAMYVLRSYLNPPDIQVSLARLLG